MMKKLRLLFCLVILMAFTAPATGLAYTGNAVGQEDQGFYYTVKEGDTLWSIAEQFSSTPWEWPEIWSENVYIDNPNRIYPGQVLQIYRGNSQPSMRPFTDNIIFYYPNIDGASFVRKTPVRPAGQIFKLDDRGTIAGAVGDKLKIYISPEARMQLGDLLTVYRPLVSSNYRFARAAGDKYEVQAIVEVIRFEGNVAEAKVIKAYKPVVKGDYVVFYTPRQQEIQLIPSNREVEGIIMASDGNNVIMGSGMVAFIDKGYENGVKPGQFYTLYETASYVTTEPQPPSGNLFQGLADIFNPRAVREVNTSDIVGECIVIHAEANASTVYILRSLKPIMEGTQFRAFIYNY